MKSLRIKVFVGVLCGLLLVAVVAEALLYRQATAFAEQGLFSSLKKYANALAKVGYVDPRNGFALYPDWQSRLKISPEDQARFFEFTTASGEYLTDSHNLGGDSLPAVGRHEGQLLVDYGNIVLGIYEHHFEVEVYNLPLQRFRLIVAENTNLLNVARRSTVKKLLYFTPLVLLAAFLISWALTTAILSSISRFTKRVQSYNRTDSRATLDLESIDQEMQPLGEALNKYMYQLNQHSNLESKLLADTAHELHTPLGVMRDELEKLKQVTHSPAELSIHAENLDNNLSGLQAMTDNMLMLYRIESGNYTPRLEALELSTVMESIVRHFRRNKKLQLEVSGENITVYSNRSVLKLIITRLLNNAIQHAAGARISVNWAAVGDVVEIHVDDAGAGIPESDQQRIFDRHYRFEDQKQAEISGTGLGLVLVRLYANSVSAQTLCTDSPIGGARFTVLFPFLSPDEIKLLVEAGGFTEIEGATT